MNVGAALVGVLKTGVLSARLGSRGLSRRVYMIVKPKTTNCSSFEDTEAPSRRDSGSHRVVDHPVRCRGSSPLIHRPPERRLTVGGGESDRLLKHGELSSKEPVNVFEGYLQ